jgi:hypothetical protein
MFNIFRADNTNAGDWWSPPIRYFRFKNPKAIDILKCNQLPNIESVFVVGGGGLGRPFFSNALNNLKRPDRKYKLISWGAGCDVAEDRAGIVDVSNDPIGSYFNGFDENGLRVFPESPSHTWVPCSSCMWPGFERYRALIPIEKIGVYEHKRVPIKFQEFQNYPKLSNAGDSIEEKLSFMARFEIIVTNSYHGVYWASLLNRKVICIPFKSGLFTFKHQPKYLKDDFSSIRVDEIATFPNALEECREANVDFFKRVVSTYEIGR